MKQRNYANGYPKQLTVGVHVLPEITALVTAAKVSTEMQLDYTSTDQRFILQLLGGFVGFYYATLRELRRGYRLELYNGTAAERITVGIQQFPERKRA